VKDGKWHILEEFTEIICTHDEDYAMAQTFNRFLLMFRSISVGFVVDMKMLGDVFIRAV
jgi:hypothetical protein